MPNPRFHGWIVAVAAALVLLPRLGATPLWDDDEPKNAACSLAMLDDDDWVVPRFDGHLRIEKPPLVNWLQIAGIALCGRNETGVRIGSALLTIGTCLLTWRLGMLLYGPSVGLIAGLAMATCAWTAVAGRASTPDAPLTFFTTLALFLFAREAFHRRAVAGPAKLSLCAALSLGAVGGAAVLAKGPIGLVIPAAACAAFAAIRAAAPPRPTLMAVVAGLRPLAVTTAFLGVAAPWYAWVTIRTNGEWLRGFILVHNMQRFAAPMEGHSGPLSYYPAVIGVGFFPWSIVLAAVAVHAVWTTCVRESPGRSPMMLMVCWLASWIGILSMAGTKLPGYIWPAYPALAVATAHFLVCWQRGDVPWLRRIGDPHRLSTIIMRVAMLVLLGGGLAISVGLPVATLRWTPDAAWLGFVGVIPVVAAVIGWRAVSAGHRRRAVATIACAGGLLTILLATVAAPRIGNEATPRALFGGDDLAHKPLASFQNAPPSLVFYFGRPVPRVETPEAVAGHLASRPDSLLVVDSRLMSAVERAIPASHDVVARVKTVSARTLVLIGPTPPRLAGDAVSRPGESP